MQQAQAIPRSAWRFFPWAVAGTMGIVIGVNVALAVFATRTFPGDVGSDGFTLSNRYNEVIQTARHATGLGWTIAVDLADGRPRIVPRDRAGAPLAGAQVQLAAQRPLGEAHVVAVAVARDAAGTFLAEAALPEAGQWDLSITVTANGETETTTHRVVRK